MRTLLLLALAAVAACSEKPPTTDRPAFKTDDWQHQLRERTLRQSESRRIYS